MKLKVSLATGDFVAALIGKVKNDKFEQFKTWLSEWLSPVCCNNRATMTFDSVSPCPLSTALLGPCHSVGAS
jgi:hypothetical protein